MGEILSNIHIGTSKVEEAGDMIKKACDEVNEGLKNEVWIRCHQWCGLEHSSENLTDMNTGMKQAQAEGLNKS
ncbi:hypothetical protein P7H22_21025 [Paenibacillus larvae]|nr:hypothetical protein [Paenibacillus larvae]MDT2242345.1 hypothetical protein [Paenibacillus larvae]